MLIETFRRTQSVGRVLQEILDAHKKSPEHGEKLHNIFLRDSSVFDAKKMHELSPQVRIGLMNYLVQYVHDNAQHHSKFITLKRELGDQTYIDESAYPYEIAIISYLKDLIRPPLQLFELLDEIARHVSDQLDDPQLGELISTFPAWEIGKKCFFSDLIGDVYNEKAQDILGIPLNTAHTIHQDNKERPNAAASFVTGEREDGSKFTGITASTISLNRPLINFGFDMSHEHTHSLFDQMADAYEESPESFSGHPYEESFFFAWAISHARQYNAHLRSLYLMDSEEFLCNRMGYRVMEKLKRHSPNYQITQQPLLEI